jgi:hypothetical protein
MLQPSDSLTCLITIICLRINTYSSDLGEYAVQRVRRMKVAATDVVRHVDETLGEALNAQGAEESDHFVMGRSRKAGPA